MFSFIAAEKANYPVAVMCRALGVNRTSFHDWERRPPSDRALTDAWLTEKIKQIHEASRRVYGAPRIHAELATDAQGPARFSVAREASARGAPRRCSLGTMIGRAASECSFSSRLTRKDGMNRGLPRSARETRASSQLSEL